MLGQRVRIAECNVRSVRSSFRAYGVKDLAHSRRLMDAIPKNWTAAANGAILFFNFWSAAAGDEGSEIALKGAEGDEVGIGLKSNLRNRFPRTRKSDSMDAYE